MRRTNQIRHSCAMPLLLLAFMKKFFLYLFNGFCWVADSMLLVLETIVKSLWSLFTFFFTILLQCGRQVQRLVDVRNWNKPLTRKRIEESYAMRAVRILSLVLLQIYVIDCALAAFSIFLQAFPQIHAFLSAISVFFRTFWIYLLALISSLILLLPQQQLLRDPVTRVFFRRGWFKNYGQASFFTKCLSFFFIIILVCNAWKKGPF
jgi:hypothetical protein